MLTGKICKVIRLEGISIVSFSFISSMKNDVRSKTKRNRRIDFICTGLSTTKQKLFHHCVLNPYIADYRFIYSECGTRKPDCK